MRELGENRSWGLVMRKTILGLTETKLNSAHTFFLEFSLK